MSKVNDLERQVLGLSAEELATFRQWFAEFDADAWDRRFASDVEAGKLDTLAQNALDAHTTGKSTKL